MSYLNSAVTIRKLAVEAHSRAVKSQSNTVTVRATHGPDVARPRDGCVKSWKVVRSWNSFWWTNHVEPNA